MNQNCEILGNKLRLMMDLMLLGENDFGIKFCNVQARGEGLRKLKFQKFFVFKPMERESHGIEHIYK